MIELLNLVNPDMSVAYNMENIRDYNEVLCGDIYDEYEDYADFLRDERRDLETEALIQDAMCWLAGLHGEPHAVWF